MYCEHFWYVKVFLLKNYLDNSASSQVFLLVSILCYCLNLIMLLKQIMLQNTRHPPLSLSIYSADSVQHKMVDRNVKIFSVQVHKNGNVSNNTSNTFVQIQNIVAIRS